VNIIFYLSFFSYLLFSEGSAKPEDSLYENAYLMLDPELQPVSPAIDIPESMQIFEEHKSVSICEVGTFYNNCTVRLVLLI